MRLSQTKAPQPKNRPKTIIPIKVGKTAHFERTKKNKENTQIVRKKKLAEIQKIRKTSITKLMARFNAMNIEDKNIPKEKNYLWIVFFVKKFIEVIKAKNLAEKLKRMGNFHHSIFGDAAFFQNDDGQFDKVKLNNPIYRLYRNKKLENLKKIWISATSFISKIENVYLIFIDKIPLFEIHSLQTTIWTLLMTAIFSYHIFDVPLDLSFDLSESLFHKSLYFFSQGLPLLTGICDMFYSLNTAYYSKGVYVKQRMKIVKNYFKNGFWLDFFSYGSLFITYFEISDSKFFELNFLFMFFRLPYFIKRLEDYFQFKDKTQGVFNLLKLIFLVLYITHLSGCLWHVIARWEIEDLNMQNTWLHIAKCVNDDWRVQYVNSLYFSIVTMVTVGYGDISPQNAVEKSFSIFMIVLTCGIYAYALNSVGIILTDMYRAENEFKMKIYAISSYMKEKKMNNILQIKVKKYLEYMFHDNQEQKRLMLFDSLSNKLKEEVQIDIYEKILKNCHFLKKNFSCQFLKRLALKVTEVTLAPEETIFARHEFTESGIYFIIKGNVKLFITKKINEGNKESAVRQKGDYFGEASLLLNKDHEMNANTTSVSQIGFVSLHNFLEAIQNFPQDYEIYCKLRDEIQIYEKQQIFERNCESCNKCEHTINTCPLLTLKKNKEKAIQKYFDSLGTQNRHVIFRPRKKFKLKANFSRILQAHRKFYLENEQFCANFIEFIENKQDELASLYSFIQDPSHSSLELDNLFGFEKKTSIKFQEKETSENNWGSKIEPTENSSKKTSLKRKMSRLSPLLKPVFEESNMVDLREEPKKEEEVSDNPKLFKTKHNLHISFQEKAISPADYVHQKNIPGEHSLDFFDFLLKFENMRNYKFYYPHNNPESVIKQLAFNMDRGNQKKRMFKRRRVTRHNQYIGDLSSAQISPSQNELSLAMNDSGRKSDFIGRAV